MVSDFGHPRTRGKGGKKGQIFADVLYGWPLRLSDCMIWTWIRKCFHPRTRPGLVSLTQVLASAVLKIFLPWCLQSKYPFHLSAEQARDVL